jgi:hypothetical protein
MKKGLKMMLATTAISAATLLAGCSCGGDIVNCITNTMGGAIDAVGCFNDCTFSRIYTSCTTCNVCNGECYDDTCVLSCFNCAEVCYSYKCSNDVTSLSTREMYDEDLSERGYDLDIDYKIDSVDKLSHAGTEYYYRVVFEVTVKFTKTTQDYSFDNVYLETELITSVGTTTTIYATSDRWIGHAKYDKTYTVKPEFYLRVKRENSDNVNSLDSYNLRFNVKGKVNK